MMAALGGNLVTAGFLGFARRRRDRWKGRGPVLDCVIYWILWMEGRLVCLAGCLAGTLGACRAVGVRVIERKRWQARGWGNTDGMGK